MPKRDAAWFRREAAKERLAAQQAISRAELWERTADEIERLKHGHQSATRVGDMDQGTDVTKKRRGRPLASGGPVAKLAKAAGVPMSELARRLGVDYDRVKQWDSRGKVPEAFRVALADAAKQ